MVVPNPSNDRDPATFGPPPCHTCNLRPANDPRNLIVCIQSARWTSRLQIQNCPPEKTTRLNVQILFDSIVETDQLKHLPRQLKYKPSIRNINSMRSVVEDAYDWLARQYNPGDQIYLFGFSWGAYEARALAGMIYEVGLIRDSNPPEEQISGAYDLYELNRSQPSSQTRKNARQFKDKICWKDLRVHFVGVWDTLSPIERRRGAMPPISSPMHACHFRHALALDADRGLYPEYLHGSMHSNAKGSNDIDTCDMKEVWFGGDHCSLGGGYRDQRWSRNGNMPLLWMHREASEKGLILKPLDLDFLPNDCYFLPRQVRRSRYSSQPRHIVPGQKVHTTVLLQMKYMGRDTLVTGIPSVQCSDINVDNEIWEPELFSDAVARQLIDDSRKDPIQYPRKLLYILQFTQGKACVRQVPRCRETLRGVIETKLEHSKTWGVEEFAVCFAYWVAFYEEETDSLSPMDRTEREWILGALGQAFEKDIDSRDIFFFPPLIRDEVLRKKFLTSERIKILLQQLDGDSTIRNSNSYFGYWTEVVADLVVCEHYQGIVIDELKIKHSGSSRSRLAWMLHTSDDQDVAAALCIVQVLSRTPQGTKLCAAVKFRLHELATTEGCIGAFAAEALISLRVTEEVRNETEKGEQRIESLLTPQPINAVVQFCKNLRDPKMRAGILLAFKDWNMANSEDPSFAMYSTSHWVFDYGFTTKALSDTQKELLDTLLSSAKSHDKSWRTTATFTLLKLCENANIRMWLLGKGILEIFVGQLRCRNSSLLAAYALLVCCKHDNLKSLVNNNPRVPKYIIKMLKSDYFNDWLGQVEGFQILGEFMKDDQLAGKLKELDILEVLESKLYAFRRKDAWRKLGYPQSNILRIFEKNAHWTDKLIDRGIEKLKVKQWSTQKVGVAVLAALAQTEYGVDAIKGHIDDIVKILLNASNENVKLCAILGPACALRVLSENETLREHVRGITQYIEWKETYLPHKNIYQGWANDIFSWTPLDRPKEHRNKAPWHVKTPMLGMKYSLHSPRTPAPGGQQLNNAQGDVQTMLNEAIRAIDEEFSDGELLPVEETLPPRIKHWRPLLIDASITFGLGTYVIVATPFAIAGIALQIAGISTVTAATIACSPIICVTGAGFIISEQLRPRDQDEGEDPIQDEGDSAT